MALVLYLSWGVGKILFKRWGLPTATNAGRRFDSDPRLQNFLNSPLQGDVA